MWQAVRALIACLALAITALPAASNSSELRGAALYDALRAIMDERKRLWFAPPPEANRDLDVSATVCPLVDADRLTELHLNSARGITHQVLASGDPVFPAGTGLWEIPGERGFLDIQVLLVWIDGDRCKAQYRHTK